VREQKHRARDALRRRRGLLTGTAAEITPIKNIDKLPVGAGSRGRITKSLQDEFFAILRMKSRTGTAG